MNERRQRSETRRLTRTIGVRLTEEDEELLAVHARAHGKTLPELVRNLLAQHLERCPAGTP